MTIFETLGLPAPLVDSLRRMKITTPTPIQSATIPHALTGQDILASAQTGSGKTIAYLLPLIIKLSESPQGIALILTPTRELAVQVHQTLRQVMGPDEVFKTALLIGGAPMFRQVAELKRRPRLVVGTPGRINDHLERRNLSLHQARFLIVDEVDRMLDMGFGIQLEQIAEYLPEERQTLMFSATLPSNIERLSKKYLREPKRISIDAELQAAPKIKQEIIRARSSEKSALLLQQLETREGSIIIFVNTKRGAEQLSRELKQLGHESEAIHGDLPQRSRDRVIRAFRTQRSRIMVATDVAARGLDIPHVMHVINYDLPHSAEDYVHRIGRTGRAGAEGNALCFVAPEDGRKWRAIVQLIDPNAKDQEGPKRSERSRRPRPGGPSPYRRRNHDRDRRFRT